MYSTSERFRNLKIRIKFLNRSCENICLIYVNKLAQIIHQLHYAFPKQLQGNRSSNPIGNQLTLEWTKSGHLSLL